MKDSGVSLGARGHIIVNEALESSVPHIYAVGDAIEVTETIHGTKATIPLAGPANKQGRIVADRIAGLPSTYKGTQGTSIIKVFGMTAATTGSNEKHCSVSAWNIKPLSYTLLLMHRIIRVQAQLLLNCCLLRKVKFWAHKQSVMMEWINELMILL